MLHLKIMWSHHSLTKETTSYPPQGKFIRIHFGPSGKLAGADIETCKYGNLVNFRIF